MVTWTKFAGWVAAVGLTVLGILYFFFYDTWVLPEDDAMFAVSIEPGLRAGDNVVISRHHLFERGQLVRCADPEAKGRWVVGRVAGLAGDDLTFAHDRFANGLKFEASAGSCAEPERTIVHPATQSSVVLPCVMENESGHPHPTLLHPPGDIVEDRFRVSVPDGRAFLVSDNRAMSLDSRHYGALDVQSCQRLVFRLWGGPNSGGAGRGFTFIQ